MALGYAFGRGLKPNSVVCFSGDLASGKTTFIKGVVAGAAQCHTDIVNSPTFVYLNIYAGKIKVYHFDLYRMQGVDDFLSMGFEDLLFAQGICCIEWSERIAALLPENCMRIQMSHPSYMPASDRESPDKPHNAQDSGMRRILSTEPFIHFEG